jgi:hypothetical protein
MLYVGLDLSRKRLDWHALADSGERIGGGASPPDRDGLHTWCTMSTATTAVRCWQ